MAAFSGDQQLAGKIKMFFALAPAAFIGHMKSPLKLLTPFAGSIEVQLILISTTSTVMYLVAVGKHCLRKKM